MSKKWPQLRLCKFCGIEFIAKSNNPTQKFCSKKCGSKSRYNRPSPYTIETECKCGCGQTFLNPDDHYRYRKFIPEHRNSNDTHPRLGYKESEKDIEKRIEAVLKSFRCKRATCIEKELYQFLNKNKIFFISQKQIGRTIVDAFIPKWNLCIYADGQYWHNRPEVKKRDEEINLRLIKKYFYVMRLKSIDNGYHLDLNPLKRLLAYSGARS